MADVEQFMINCALVSFDVFDTLLVRSYMKPTDVFERLEVESGMSGFAAARQSADHESVRMAMKGGRDATIDDAYALMPAMFRGLRGRELELEREGLEANAEIVEVWKRAGELGKKRVIASDMYLPRSFLESVLRENGIDGWDAFYLSCDCGVRKSNGKMYELMLRDLGVPADRVLHIGDNAESDGLIPARMGIKTWKVEKVVDRVMAANLFLQKFLSADGSLEARRLVASVCVAWHNFASVHPGCPYWARIGGLVGSVFATAYVSFLVREARARRIDQMLFVARDGYVLEKLFNAVVPEIKTNYVYAPRLVKNSDDPKLHAEYVRYVESLGIGEGKSVAVVDSVSWHYSAQKLIAESLGHNVYGFSFVALEKPTKGSAFLFAPQHSLRWCHLVEQFFMANEPPIDSVIDGCPVYKDPLPEEERTRIAVFNELADAELVCAEQLLKEGVEIHPVRLLDYIDSFLVSMSDEDARQFDAVKNSNDTRSEDYAPIIRPDWHWKTVWRTFKKIPIYKRHYGREGLKMVTHDKLFGLFEFRKIEEDL